MDVQSAVCGIGIYKYDEEEKLLHVVRGKNMTGTTQNRKVRCRAPDMSCRYIHTNDKRYNDKALVIGMR